MKTQLAQTVALTGATGLMGRRVVPVLRQSGAELRLLTRTTQPQSAQPDCKPIVGDLSNEESLHELLRGADALVHLAGIAHTELRTDGDRAHAFAVNVTGTRNLLAAAREAGVRRVVLMSSAHVYAGRTGIGLTESSPTQTGDDYAGMKLQAEAAAHDLLGSGMDLVILRPCLTYGPGVRFNLQNLMRAVKRGYYVHPGGADAVRSFVSVDTVAAAVAHLLQRGQPPGTFNLADREAVSLRAWVDHLATLLSARPPRAVPVSVLRGLAALGTGVARLGLPAPLTQDKLNKLTAPFSLNVDALAATGFTWPGNTEEVLRAMTQMFLATQTAAGRKPPVSVP